MALLEGKSAVPIEDFGEDVTKHAATPAKANLFEVDEQWAKLCEDKADRFHSVVAKLLYISPRGRIDIQLAIAFLCTRVSCSTDQDWEKVKRVMQFLNRTLDDYMIIGADCLNWHSMTTMRMTVVKTIDTRKNRIQHLKLVMSTMAHKYCSRMEIRL
jgi:hypothetical protein